MKTTSHYAALTVKSNFKKMLSLTADFAPRAATEPATEKVRRTNIERRWRGTSS